MKDHLSATAATFTPQAHKTFENALCAFLQKEFPQLAGERSRIALAKGIIEIVHQFFPKTDHLRAGQVVWPTVHKDEKGAYGKRIDDSQLTCVTLDLVQPKDAQERADGKKLRDIRKEAAARLCLQAYEQDGCLTNAEIAILLKISAPTVSLYIKEWENENDVLLPRRGTIHDMGPSLTHKKAIIHKLFIEQKSVQKTARETHHSFSAIQRYIATFRQVLLCRQKGMNSDEIAFAIRRTKALVKEYEDIIDRYAQSGYRLEKLLSHFPHFETAFETCLAECQEEMDRKEQDKND